MVRVEVVEASTWLICEYVHGIIIVRRRPHTRRPGQLDSQDVVVLPTLSLSGRSDSRVATTETVITCDCRAALRCHDASPSSIHATETLARNPEELVLFTEGAGGQCPTRLLLDKQFLIRISSETSPMSEMMKCRPPRTQQTRCNHFRSSSTCTKLHSITLTHSRTTSHRLHKQVNSREILCWSSRWGESHP